MVPTEEEMMTLASPILPILKVCGKYGSMVEYLETHFSLLREDCMEPLRVGVQQYRSGASGRDVIVYPHVWLAGLRCGKTGLEYCIHFEVQWKRAVQWESSKRLMFGSLLCLSCDKFRSLAWATV